MAAPPGAGAVITPAGAALIPNAIPIHQQLKRHLAGKNKYYDYGDINVAWDTIGLATYPKPALNIMLDYVARLVTEVSALDAPPAHPNTRAARRRRMGKVMMAAHTLLQFRFERFDLDQQIYLQHNDRVATTPWANVAGPVAPATLDGIITNHKAQINNLKLQYRDAAPLQPSPQQLGENREEDMIQFKPIFGRSTRSV